MNVTMALALLSAAAQGEAIAPAGKWSIRYEQTQCLLSRAYGSANAAVLLDIIRVPVSRGGTIILSDPAAAADARAGRGRVTLQPSGKRFDATWKDVGKVGERRRSVRIGLPEDFWAALPESTGMTIDVGRPSAVELELGAIRPALSAYAKCNDDLLRAWGADPAAVITDRLSVAEWFRYEDYPEAAIARRAQGRSVAVGSVDPNGRVTRCRIVESAGDRDLDAQTCAVLLRSARFPRGAPGGPATRWAVVPMSWVLPYG